jgi:hypothetical protein
MEEMALEAVALEEMANEAAQGIGVGARMEATSHYVPTVGRMGSTSLMAASCYQQTRVRSQQISLMGSLCMRRRWDDKDWGKIVIA